MGTSRKQITLLLCCQQLQLKALSVILQQHYCALLSNGPRSKACCYIQTNSHHHVKKLTDYYCKSGKTLASETTAIPKFEYLPSPLNLDITQEGTSEESPSSISTFLTKHRQSGFDITWQKKFQWVTTKVEDTADGEVLGMLCCLC